MRYPGTLSWVPSRGNHLCSQKITFTFPGRGRHRSKQAQTGKGTGRDVTDQLIKKVVTALSVLHKTCQWASGERGTGWVAVKINPRQQPDMKGQEPGRDLHSHRQMSGQCMLKTTQEERLTDPGKRQWSSPEREAKIITLS